MITIPTSYTPSHERSIRTRDSDGLQAWLLSSRGLRPQLQKLDNEASNALQQHLASVDVDFQLVPPHVHRCNAAERAIRTFKNHFIAGLCSTDANFPLKLWDHLLPQALITLNLLRGSRINPQLSAWAQSMELSITTALHLLLRAPECWCMRNRAYAELGLHTPWKAAI